MMRRTTFRRAALAAALALGLGAGLAPAQDFPAAPSHPWSHNTPLPVPPVPPPNPPTTEQVVRPHPLRDFWHNHWCPGCYDHFNNITCGSLHSEAAFVFGGCRTFFGEACLPKQPHKGGGAAGAPGCPTCPQP